MVFVTIFYFVVFLSGLLGNISVIIVIIKSKGLHCAMNYYLISLAIADVLIIVLGRKKFKSSEWKCNRSFNFLSFFMFAT